MHYALDATHDPKLQSWVPSAHAPDTDFPIQNLPFGRFRAAGTPASAPWRIGVAIGDQVLDLQVAGIVDHADMAMLLALEPAARAALRTRLSEGLRSGSPLQQAWSQALVPQADVVMGLPCAIGDYTDFYTSIHHATTVGKQFRPNNPLLPNYRWVPIGYHGRASSIVPSGQAFRRPRGQTMPPGATEPRLGACQRLDYELELGIVMGRANALGEPVDITQAEAHVFGIALFNDWSARDIQGWEYQPLGPFLAKNFASTLSAWVVTMEALAPFRAPFARADGEPQPLPYLDSPANREAGALDIELEVCLQTAVMRNASHAGDVISRANYRDAYWTLAQLVAHHTVNGCNLQGGDLLGTGTLSGPEAAQGGSLMELSVGGKQPLTLSNGETRAWLQDGDTVILRAYCQREGHRRIGFGECRGTVLPALAC